MAEPIARYLDEEGRVTRWPGGKGKTEEHKIILEYLASKFADGVIYSEREVNDILKRFHTFEDWAMLRRELFERGYLNRTSNGTQYWRTKTVRFL